MQIVEWLNEASMTVAEDIKVVNICKVQEFLLNKEPHLLQLYLDDVLQFSIDKTSEVRKTITGFIEEAGLLSLIYVIFYASVKNTIIFFGYFFLFQNKASRCNPTYSSNTSKISVR